MPQPSATDVFVDEVLTNISIAYIQDSADFIAGDVFPSVPVEQESGKYFTFTKADWFRDESQRRGDAEESAGSGYNLSTASFNCDVFSIHKDVGKLAKANSKAPIDWRRNATQFVTQRQLLRKEIQWVADCFATSVWDTDKTVSSTWDDFSNSDPIGDIATGKKTILQNTGFLPNTLVLGYDVWEKLENHPDIVARMGANNDAIVSEEFLARVLKVPRVLVAKAVKNSAVENATASYAFTHGKNALLCYSNPAPAVEMPSAGYTFEWTGVSDGLGKTLGVREIDMPHLGPATRIESDIAFDYKVVASDMGYFFTSVVA